MRTYCSGSGVSPAASRVARIVGIRATLERPCTFRTDFWRRRFGPRWMWRRFPRSATWCAARSSGFEESRVPLLGVMGAFVFAAQMINFPVGMGTSGHLVGGALLAYHAGAGGGERGDDGDSGDPGAGISGWRRSGAGRQRHQHGDRRSAGGLPAVSLSGGAAVAASLRSSSGGLLSVLVSAVLALAELLLSGVRMPGARAGRFAGSVSWSRRCWKGDHAGGGASARSDQSGVRAPADGAKLSRAGHAGLAPRCCWRSSGVLFASTASGRHLETGGAIWASPGSAQALIPAPLADYQVGCLQSPWLRKAAGGLAGLG